jgi:diacylglycerol O-acyltransferase / wax synthase
MIARLTPVDAMFLHLEGPATPMHVGAVLVLDPPPGGVDAARFTAQIGARLESVPRLRRRLRPAPGGVGAPCWAEDPRFDLGYHVRHVALPGPGGEELLDELVADVLSAPLDRDRPLWEVCVVEGLSGGRAALVAKVHHAVGDGRALMQMGWALLGAEAPPAGGEDVTGREPTGALAVADSVLHLADRTRSAAGRLVGAALGPPDTDGLVRSAVRLARVGRRAVSGDAVEALHGPTGPRRRLATVTASLAEHRAVRRAHGGTVNDVVLAAVGGALRRWLAARGEAPEAVRALVPTSTRARDGGSGGNCLSAHLVDLPVGVADPLERLRRIRTAMDARKRRGPMGLAPVTTLADLVPPAVQGLGAQLLGRHSALLYDVLVTNVPGPPRPLHAAGARVASMTAAVPLAEGQAVAVGVVSYDGVVHYGITVDRDAVPDLDVLAAALRESITELVDRSVPDLALLHPAAPRPDVTGGAPLGGPGRPARSPA